MKNLEHSDDSLQLHPDGGEMPDGGEALDGRGEVPGLDNSSSST